MLSNRSQKAYIQSVSALSLLSLALLGFRIIMTDTTRYAFIPGNLALAWAGLIFGWLLVNQLKVRRWLSWQNICLSLLWLFFLPNTWYTLTDFVHVYPTGEVGEMYDIVLMGTLVLNGFILGMTSLWLVHRELTKRLSLARSYALVELVILGASFAIYLGRILRWNSWDVLTNPTGLILNVSDRVVDPLGHPSAVDLTGLFFVLLSVSYFAFWRGMQVVPTSKSGR